MPELPEVETVRRSLQKLVLNQIIHDVDVFYPPIVNHQQDDFKKLVPQTIEDIKRYGKYLVFILTDVALVVHLRMEGKFYIKTTEPLLKHEHVVFHLSDQTQLRYHDVRKFGRVLIRNKKNYLQEEPLSYLAKEPEFIDFEAFYKILSKRSQAIKTVCLDQRVVAGLGNIYVDETLFLSGIHPLKPANKLTKTEAQLLIEHAKFVLQKATDLGGSTIRSYTSSLGIHGRFQNELNIHLKKDQPCIKCQTPIIKIRVGGRGTYVCQTCQKT